MDIDKKTYLKIIAITIAVGFIGINIFIYTPLVRELKMKYVEVKRCEMDVLDAHNLIMRLNQAETDRAFLAEKDLSFAIEELTSEGKARGVRFISITPKEAQKKREAQYEVLPIVIEIESTHDQLGEFLGVLDELKKSLVTIRRFTVNRRSHDDSTVLRTDLMIYVYLLASR